MKNHKNLKMEIKQRTWTWGRKKSKKSDIAGCRRRLRSSVNCLSSKFITAGGIEVPMR
jgi:hypothetical protein